MAHLFQQDDEEISTESGGEYRIPSAKTENERAAPKTVTSPIRKVISPSSQQQSFPTARVEQALSTPISSPHHTSVLTSPFTLRTVPSNMVPVNQSYSDRYRISFIITKPPLIHLLSPSPTCRLAAAAQANPSPVNKTALTRLSHLQSPSKPLLAPVYIPPLSPTHFYMSIPSSFTQISTQSTQLPPHENLKQLRPPETEQPAISSSSLVDRDSSPQDTQDTIPFFLKHAPATTVQLLQMYTSVYEHVNDVIHSTEVVTSTHAPVSSDDDSDNDSVSEFRIEDCSDQSSEDSIDHEKKQRYIRGIQKNRVCPELQRIYQGDYSVYDSPEGETIVYGDYPILQGIFTFYGSRSKLFDIIQTLFPERPIPFSSLMRRTANIRYPHNRTDLCPICYRHDECLQMKKRHPQHLFWTSSTYLTYEKAYDAHTKLRLNQRAAVLAQIKRITANESVIIGDYKEKILLPIELNQISTSFYTKFQITCLTFVCYRKLGNETSKRVVTFLSRYLNHHATFTLHCFNQLLQLEWFRGLNTLSVWTDGGRHFRSLEYLRGILDNHTSDGIIPNCSVNYFAPYHGKSEVDAVFGVFAHILKHPDRARIDCLDDLYECLQKECQRFTHSSKYTSVSYLFIKFVLSRFYSSVFI